MADSMVALNNTMKEILREFQKQNRILLVLNDNIVTAAKSFQKFVEKMETTDGEQTNPSGNLQERDT